MKDQTTPIQEPGGGGPGGAPGLAREGEVIRYDQLDAALARGDQGPLAVSRAVLSRLRRENGAQDSADRDSARP